MSEPSHPAKKLSGLSAGDCCARSTGMQTLLQQNAQQHGLQKSLTPTTVVRIRRKGGEIVQGCDVYVGRRLYMGGWRLEESDWANPFTVKQCGSNEEACKRYEVWIKTERPDLIARLSTLQGKVLGCWCKPKACHADVLARLADSLAAETIELVGDAESLTN
jgi:hypothetical protein